MSLSIPICVRHLLQIQLGAAFLGMKRNSSWIQGVALWHRLVELLEPDLIFISVAKGHLPKLRFKALSPWETLHRIERDNPYTIEGCRLQVSPNKSSLTVFGKASQLPFGTVSSKAKHLIGQEILELVRG